ncbi:hypothetical protein [Hamadaea tsunoensis]|uniref:hypothetical protein n=1 Tax=Hamadaea tsunoensis TaxID=53368 RepID=UPI00042749E5|nr:hypothetical protein [Hamadaea tsunoensis]
MSRHDYATVQDIVRTAIAGYTAVSDDDTQTNEARQQARTDRDTAAATLQRMRTATDTTVGEIGHQYAAIVAAQNR